MSWFPKKKKVQVFYTLNDLELLLCVSRHLPSALLTFFAFRFEGFISNLTQSTTRQLDSRTSYTQPCSQTTGKKPFCDLLPCSDVLDLNCFIRLTRYVNTKVDFVSRVM